MSPSLLAQAGADDMKVVSSFTDFLEKGLTLDPTKRMTVVDAFRHPFLSSK
jgi:serine/threonine protein kinase